MAAEARFGPRPLAPSPSTERGKEERWFEQTEAELRQVEEEIDRLAAQLWGITEEELEEIRRALTELKAG